MNKPNQKWCIYVERPGASGQLTRHTLATVSDAAIADALTAARYHYPNCKIEPYREKPSAYLGDRPVYIEEWEGEGVDSFVTSAFFLDGEEEELTEKELLDLDIIDN